MGVFSLKLELPKVSLKTRTITSQMGKEELVRVIHCIDPLGTQVHDIIEGCAVTGSVVVSA